MIINTLKISAKVAKIPAEVGSEAEDKHDVQEGKGGGYKGRTSTRQLAERAQFNVT